MILTKKLKDNRLWHTGVVKRGRGEGKRLLSFPTVNLDPSLLGEKLPRGVYASWVQIGKKQYMASLYYGPRKVLKETSDVLEIHILGFDKNIYGKKVKFTLGKFIRGVENFNSFADLQKRISTDVEKTIEALKEN